MDGCRDSGGRKKSKQRHGRLSRFSGRRFPMRIQVVAGILCEGDGRVLLAERKNDQPFKGLWEFPGGKAKTAETPEQALCRELHEELGIEVTRFQRLVSIDHDYADRLVHIDFFLVTAWRGDVRAMDGQALWWVLPAEIDKRDVLPADVEVVDVLRSL
jgi:8-oxo-dGTP diphosphatase